MWNKIIDNSYLNHKDNTLSAIIINITNLNSNKYLIRRNYLQIIAENFRILIRKIFLNIRKIIRSLLIVYTRHKHHRHNNRLRRHKHWYSNNYYDSYKYNNISGSKPRRSRIIKNIVRVIIILLIILIIIDNPSYIKQIIKVLQTSINNISAIIQSIIISIQPTINSTWIFQFFDIVNQYRQSIGAPSLQYCPWLDNFAHVRFETMIQNPAISHYGFDQDYNEYLSQYQDFLSVSEEVLYPDGYTPKDYVQLLQSEAPIHWEGLIDSNYTYYGYYIGYGPTYVTIGSCPVTEIVGSIDVPQYLQSYGCSVELENATWLVIELSNWCSGPTTITVSTINEGLSPQYYIYLPIQYNLPTNDEYVELVINITSTNPVELFLFTPDQFNYFENLYQQEAWSFTGPAYYYGGESTTFNTEIKLNTAQLANSGYYLVISNVLPNAQYTYIVGNITIIYTPTTPNTLATTGS
jgi:uncharacterized protein YkwD